MQDSIRVFAGQCRIRHEADETTTTEGAVLVVVKPDNTVLVHDASGYRPAAWLTRADSIQIARQEGSLDLTARKGSESLTVAATEPTVAVHPVSPAGVAVGTCPACDGTMVRAGGEVSCLDCGDSFRLPRDATVTDATCESCGLPTIHVDRGAAFEVCLDRSCGSIDAAVRDRFDEEWPCSSCGTPLRIERERTLQAVCPTCERSHPIPTGTVAGTCDCGLPWVETERGGRCLDTDCSVESAGPARAEQPTT